ncbi:hypothetical protein ACQ5SK_17210 [Bradyrhizobium japonicum]
MTNSAPVFTPSVTRVSTSATGAQADDQSYQPVLSADGTKVAFESYADNLVPGDTNGAPDIFVKDLTTGAITLVSTNASGVQGDSWSYQPVFCPMVPSWRSHLLPTIWCRAIPIKLGTSS